jgi:uncharacterized membrane protein YfcA
MRAQASLPRRAERPDPVAPRLDGQLVVIGVVGGVLSGLLGVGGGIVMVPLLVLWAHYGQRDAHAASLGAIIPISIAGIATYGIAGEVRVGPAIALAAGSIFGAQIGTGLLARLDERVLKTVFGVFLLAVAVRWSFTDDRTTLYLALAASASSPASPRACSASVAARCWCRS